jgi:AraC-like DNA-binding protein
VTLADRDEIRLWKDQRVLGGMDILRARCVGYRYPPHAHDVYVVAAFRGGAQRHRISRKDGVALPGSVMIIPPGEVHTGEAARRGVGWEYAAFYPSAQQLSNISEDLFGHARGSLDFGMSFLVEDKELSALLLSANDAVWRAEDALACQGAVQDAFEVLIERYGQRSVSHGARRPQDPPIQKGVEFIHDNLNTKLKMKDVADAAGLSEFHFMRIFRSRMDMTVYQYLMHLRLEQAKVMLASGVPVVLAAANVGFYDQSHFTKYFHRLFGVTPSRYAKACR